jgi:hypothetical protein
MPKPQKDQKQRKIAGYKKEISKLERKIEEKLECLKKTRGDRMCFPFLGVKISPQLVDDVYDDLRANYKDCNGCLDVIVDSGGGDIDAAYNLAMLFRKYGHQELNFIVPRWAKSAATLLVCSGNRILMTPVAELGPLDPQITELNPLEGRLEQFSPLHIESTLDLIREEFGKGNEKLANGLLQRLQFPLTLGSFRKSLDIAEQYLTNLFEARMIIQGDSPEAPKKIANRLTRGYADHGYCIKIDEAKAIGLNVSELAGEELDLVWEIHRLNSQKRKIQKKMREEEVMSMIKELPPELLDKLPPSLQQKLKSGAPNAIPEEKT